VGRLPIITDDIFGNPKIAAPNHAPNGEVLVGKQPPRRPDGEPTTDALAGLGVLQHGVVVVDLILSIVVTGLRRSPVPVQRSSDARGKPARVTDTSARAEIEEVQEYGLLAQNNEGSALSITTLETHAGLVVQQAAEEIDPKRVRRLKEIQNSTFYVVKLVSGDTVIHAVRKTDATWHTKNARNKMTVYFVDQQLGLDDVPRFDLFSSIDFFIVGDGILIRNKAHFESILSYKEAHKDDFAALQAEDEFTAIFSDLGSLRAHIGENKIQLRRASAIRQKGHYKDANFMINLRGRYAEFGLNLLFDATGRIVPTADTCRDIIVALLDHRLESGFSKNIYDVPDARPVAV